MRSHDPQGDQILVMSHPQPDVVAIERTKICVVSRSTKNLRYISFALGTCCTTFIEIVHISPVLLEMLLTSSTYRTGESVVITSTCNLFLSYRAQFGSVLWVMYSEGIPYASCVVSGIAHNESESSDGASTVGSNSGAPGHRISSTGCLRFSFVCLPKLRSR